LAATLEYRDSRGLVKLIILTLAALADLALRTIKVPS
jgi:hypothetical protein